MFTLNIRNIVAVGKGGVKWNTALAEKTTQDPKSSEQKSAEIALKDIKDYKGSDNIVLASLMNNLHKANEKFAKINNTESAKIDIELTQAIDSESNPEKKQILKEIQGKRAEKIATAKVVLTYQADTVKVTTQENLNDLRGDIVVARILKLEDAFFKGEITTMDNMAELILATQKAIDTKASPKTKEDWNKLGYTGEWAFDAKEVAVANSFYEKVNGNNDTKKLVAELARETQSHGAVYLRDKLAGTRTVQDANNNLTFQSKRFLDYVSQVGGKSPAITQFTELFKKQNPDNAISNNAIDLGNTNIPGLLRSLVNGHVYVQDGAYGSNERFAVKTISEFYTKNKDAMTPIFTQMLAYYDANMTSDHAFSGISRREKIESDANSVKEFLADLNQDGKIGNDTTNKEQRGDTAWIKESTLAKSLGELTTDTQLVKGVNNILSLAGSKTSYKDFTALVAGLKTDASVYPQFVQGVNIALRNGSLKQVLKNNSLTLLDQKTSRFIGLLETKEGIQAVKASLKTKLDASGKAIVEDSKLSPQEKQAALKVIQDSESKINDPKFLEQVSRDFSIAITNNRLGLSGSSSHSLESLLADSMTVGVFVGKEFTGPSIAGLGISFDKNIASGKGYDASLIYGAGWTGVAGITPFIGISTRVKDWKVAIVGSAVGTDLYIGQTLGNLDASIAQARELSNTSGLGKKMDEFSKDTNNKSNTFSLTPSDVDKVAFDKLTPEQKEQNIALANTFSKGTRARLEKGGFDTEKNTLKRYLMIQTALADTVQQYIDTLNIDAVKGGWSAKEIGVHLGVMASIPYILPGISFGKKDVKFEEKIVRQESIEKLDKQDIGSALAKLGYSISTPVISGDKKSYSISLQKIAGFDVANLGKIDTKLSFDTKTLTLSGLTKGLNISIKNGSIVITENDRQVDFSPAKIDPTIDKLNPPDTFKVLLQQRKTRVQLATLTTDRRQNGGYDKANAFIKMLDGVTDWANQDDNGRKPLLASLNAFLDVGIKANYDSLKAVRKELNTKNIDQLKFRAMVMEVRATMMTDSSQALGLNAKVGEGSKESMQVHWNNMLTKPSPLSGTYLKDILPSGLAIADFDNLVVGKNKEFMYNEGKIEPKMFGLIGAWKFKDAGLKFMPPGTVRIATDSKGGQYEKSLTDTTKREAVFTEMMKNPEFQKVVKSIQTQTTLDDSQLKTLITTGEVTQNGVNFAMNNTFKVFAYGKCANPSYGLILGSVIRNGQNISEPNVTGEILKVSEDYASRAHFIDTNIGLLVGQEGEKPTVKTPDQTEYKTEIQTRDVQVSPTNITIINGSQVVNIPGGGTVPVNQLTVAQRVALNNGTLTLRTQVTVTTPSITPGTISTPDTPRATVALGILTLINPPNDDGSTEILVNYPELDAKKFRDSNAVKEFLKANQFVQVPSK